MAENREYHEELYKRYLEAKKKGWGAVYRADIRPAPDLFPWYSVKLLDRLYSSTKSSESDTKNL